MNLGSRLNNRAEVYGKVPYANELNEKDFRYEKIKDIWCEITVAGGNIKTTEGNSIYAEISHKITIRSKAIPNLSNDMYFIYKGNRYDIKYSQPNYKYKDSIEIMCTLVVE